MNESKAKNTKTLRIGSFSIIISVVVLAIVIAANLVVSSLPGWIIRPDTTAEGMFTISDATREIVDALETDITLYHVVQAENVDPVVEEILERYADLSSHIKVSRIDPVQQPTFLSQYTTSSVAENSIIAVSDKRSTVIDGNQLYMYMLEGDDLNYYTRAEYENIYQTFASYYGQYIGATEYFFGENELTRAIDYVATDELPVLYMVGGHGEMELAETFASAWLQGRKVRLEAGETTRGHFARGVE